MFILEVFCFFFFFFNDTAPTEIYTLSYTTLFRSCLLERRAGGRAGFDGEPAARAEGASAVEPGEIGGLALDRVEPRSEEHTSELQSRRDLVCRLLLEKKKQQTTLVFLPAASLASL